MKPKTAKITIRARGYGKSITLNDAQTDLVLRALGNELEFLIDQILTSEGKDEWQRIYGYRPPKPVKSTGPQMEEHQMLKTIQDLIAEGPK